MSQQKILLLLLATSFMSSSNISLTTKIQQTERGDTGYALDLETIEMLKLYQ